MKPEHQQRLLSVAQEISFAKALSSNDKSLRDRALRRLKKWFLAKSDNSNNFTEDGFMRIWKGLFYSVWMSDKPLIQEDLVEDVSQLIHCFSNFSDASMFARCFFQAMSQAWFGIDSFRLDKFMMLLRRFLRQCFDYLSRQGWKKRQVTTFSDDLSNSLRMAPTGMNLHIAELYLEELAKIGKGKLKEETVLLCVKPFGRLLSETTDTRLISNITDNIFCYLLRQSDLGIKYQIKFEAWKQLGFPGGHIDALEEVEQAEDENSVSEDGMDDTETNSELDPRAGRVDVLLPTLAFNAKAIVQMLKQLRTDKETTTKARKAIASIIDR
ncbi:hypothetical protein AAG570_003384 [Ranatra chinensis]|uniref:Uncharacterized protein n=1 Tax=Ranatra chinensis TaxID=642074 RepID=A0ABD0Y3F6_9HEMI